MKKTLSEFASKNVLTNLWFVSTGHPAGIEYIHNIETDCEEDYCDLYDLQDELEKFGDAEGQITSNGIDIEWAWDGEGEFSDCWCNTILNLKAWASAKTE